MPFRLGVIYSYPRTFSTRWAQTSTQSSLALRRDHGRPIAMKTTSARAVFVSVWREGFSRATAARLKASRYVVLENAVGRGEQPSDSHVCSCSGAIVGVAPALSTSTDGRASP